MLKLNPDTLRKHFLQLNTSGPGMFKLVVMCKYLENTSPIETLGENLKIIFKDEFTNI